MPPKKKALGVCAKCLIQLPDLVGAIGLEPRSRGKTGTLNLDAERSSHVSGYALATLKRKANCLKKEAICVANSVADWSVMPFDIRK
jgi:hypothetical protein